MRSSPATPSRDLLAGRQRRASRGSEIRGTKPRRRSRPHRDVTHERVGMVAGLTLPRPTCTRRRLSPGRRARSSLLDVSRPPRARPSGIVRTRSGRSIAPGPRTIGRSLVPKAGIADLLRSRHGPSATAGSRARWRWPATARPAGGGPLPAQLRKTSSVPGVAPSRSPPRQSTPLQLVVGGDDRPSGRRCARRGTW